MKIPDSHQPMPSSAQKVFSGVTFEVYQWQQELYDGTVSTYEKLTRADSVCCLAVTTERKLLVTKQIQPLTEPFMTLPGGVVDPGETPTEAILRELSEETGHQAQKLTHWFSHRPGSRIEWVVHTFIARDCQPKTALSPDSGEKITVFEVSYSEFMELMYQPDFRDQHVAMELLRAQKSPQTARKLQKFILYGEK